LSELVFKSRLYFFKGDLFFRSQFHTSVPHIFPPEFIVLPWMIDSPLWLVLKSNPSIRFVGPAVPFPGAYFVVPGKRFDHALVGSPSTTLPFFALSETFFHLVFSLDTAFCLIQAVSDPSLLPPFPSRFNGWCHHFSQTPIPPSFVVRGCRSAFDFQKNWRPAPFFRHRLFSITALVLPGVGGVFNTRNSFFS